MSAFSDRIRPLRTSGAAPLRFREGGGQAATLVCLPTWPRRICWRSAPGSQSRASALSTQPSQHSPAAHQTQRRPRARRCSPPPRKCIPATRDGKRHQNSTGMSTALLSPNKELTSAGNVKMLFRTSVLRCLTQRRDCCAREQSDPVFTKQGFSRCTFCFQNTQDYSKFSSWGKDATSGSERGDNRNLSQRS